MQKLASLIILIGSCLLCGAESLPRVEIAYDTLTSSYFVSGTFRLIDKTDTICTPMNIRHRGATSLRYDKPSYAVKLCDTAGVKLDTALLDMRSDNYWILDAMAVDKARMRNRVAMDLWLEFSRKPWYQSLEPKMINGYRGKMVEVYVNDSAQGIYCLMERVDRKQLKLKKYKEDKGIQGTLYKAFNNVRSSAFYLPTWLPDNTVATYDSWEIKYPDIEDGEPITWAPLYNMLYAINKTTNISFADTLNTYLDVPVLEDYVLFCQLLSARDNERKNVEISFYKTDTKKGVYTPWDFDHSWGRQYNSTEETADNNLFTSHNLFIRANRYYPQWQDTLAHRWADLRQHYFTIEHIDSLFAGYFALFAQTGMDTVEAQLWSGHNNIEFDIPSEQQYIHDWVAERLVFLDSIYHYDPTLPIVPTVLTQPQNENGSTATKVLRQGHLYIRKGGKLYDALGRKTEDE